MDNFLRMSFPFNEEVLEIERATSHVTEHDTKHDTEHDTEHVKNLISLMDDSEYKRDELMRKNSVSHREYFRSSYLKPAIEKGLIELTIPNKPKSKNQKYRLTSLGQKLREKLK